MCGCNAGGGRLLLDFIRFQVPVQVDLINLDDVALLFLESTIGRAILLFQRRERHLYSLL